MIPENIAPPTPPIVESKKNSFFGNAMWFSLGGFFMQGVAFAANILFAKFLGTEGNGQVVNYIFWQTLFTAIISWQINATINNAAVTFGQHRLDEYIFTLVRFCLLPFLLLIGLSLALPGIVSSFCDMPAQLVTLSVINAGLVALVNIASFACITLGQRVKYLAYTIGSSLLNVGLSLGLINYFRSNPILPLATGRMLGYTLGWLPAAIVALYLMIKKRRLPPSLRDTSLEEGGNLSLFEGMVMSPPPRGGCRRSRQGEHSNFLKYALPLALPLVASEVAQVILMRSNGYFTKILMSDSASGLYGMANSLGGVGIMAAAALGGAWTPWYFQQSATKKHGTVNRMMKKYIMFFAAFICGAMAVLPDLIHWFFPDFSGSEICLPPILMCGFALLLYNMVANYHLLREKSYFITIISVSSGLLSIALSLILIPAMGILGAASAQLICYLIQLTAAVIIGRYVIKGLNIKSGILIAGLLMAGLFAVFTYTFMSIWIIRWLAGVLCGVYCLINAKRMMKPDDGMVAAEIGFAVNGAAAGMYLF